ncbi:MAG: OmpA family protein, partial [Kiritimatiellae bacterium]|nr:OmpA family protein [Kiritimatiellia bacterium]
MNKATIKFAVALVAVASLAATGCRGNKGKTATDTGAYDDGEFGISAYTDDETGLAVTGEPFDLNRTPATDISVQPVYFGYDSFQLPPAEIAKIQQAADILRNDSGCVLIVEGHCDERGSNEYNLELGSLRAISIRDYLATLGIDGNRIQTKS